jgi:hypothetical protein
LAKRLKEIFVIKPTEELQKYTWDDIKYFIHEGQLKERPSTELVSLEHSSSGQFAELIEKKAQGKTVGKTKKEVVIEEVQNAIKVELPNIKDLTKQAQIDALTNLLIEKQLEMLQEGNLEAGNTNNILEDIIQAIMHHPIYTDQLIEASDKVLGIKSQQVANEYKKMLSIYKNIKRKA